MHLLIDGLGSRVGGGITGLMGLVKALTTIAPDHKYSIVLSSLYQRDLIDKFSDMVNVISVKLSTNLLMRTFYQNISLNKLISEINADVVYFSGEAACFNIRIPSILLCGNLSLFADVEQFGDVSRKLRSYQFFRRPIALRAMRCVTKIGFVSSELRRIVLSKFNISESKTFVMPHGVDDAFYDNQVSHPWLKRFGGRQYILCVSAINQHKGYETLLRAYADLPDDYPPLVIAGPMLHQPTYYKMVELIKSRRIQHQVFILGNVNYDELPDLYSGAALFIFPSDLESFGIPLLEAMASGMPIVASNLPICRDVCGEAAIYFAKGDAHSLSHEIRLLMSNAGMRSELSLKAKQRSYLFTWQDTARKFINIAEQLSIKT